MVVSRISNNLEIMKNLFSKGYINANEPEFLYKQTAIPAVSVKKIDGLLLGIAIGDALGNTTEIQTPKERHMKYGVITDYLPNKHAHYSRTGLPSDDTQLAFDTLAIILSRNYLDINALANIFSSHKIFGLGGSVREFLRNFKIKGLPWYKAGSDSAGNGALMRISPVIIPYFGVKKAGLWADVVLDTMLTHNDPLAIGSSVAFVDMLITLLQTKKSVDVSGILDKFCFVLGLFTGNKEYASRIKLKPPFSKFGKLPSYFIKNTVRYALENDISVEKLGSYIGSGAYLLETVPIVLYIIMKYFDNPEEALIQAINNTKDNDTIGAIVGTTFGAMYGVSSFKPSWISNLSGKTRKYDTGEIFRLIENSETFLKKRWSNLS